VGETVRYVAHREETLPEGRTRETYGIGPRYRELRGDEAAPRADVLRPASSGA
jgi:hypothetical protein